MQSLVGSTAILLTIPLTSIICGILYTDKDGSRFGKTKPAHDKIVPAAETDSYVSTSAGEKKQYYYAGKNKTVE